MSSRVVGICVDDSEFSLTAAQWACRNVVRPQDAVHLVCVILPVSSAAGGIPMPVATPISTTVDPHELSAAYQEELKKEEARCGEVLRRTRTALGEVQCASLKVRALEPMGGASGIGRSLVEWAKNEDAGLIVVGSRGMGAVKSTLMSVVNLGSVSSYLLHNVACPVCLVRGKGLEAPRKAVRKVLVAVDDSEAAQRAQRWAEDYALGPHDELHLVCCESGDVVPGTGVANAVMIAAGAAEAAVPKVDRSRIVHTALEPLGATSRVGRAVTEYAQQLDVDLVVLGSRGVGAVKRALLSVVGLGSVSEWCAHNLECPLVIVK